MKRNLLTSALCIVALSCLAQTPKTAINPPAKAKPISPLADYAGDWNSSFDGRVWLRLRLVLQGDKLTGAMIHSRNVTTDDSGGLKSVSEEQSNETVSDAVLNPDGLLLTLKDAESQETNRYLMRLVYPSKEAADLKVIGANMPPGMAKPKPWHVVKTNTTSSPSRH
jgi:hypothetical protein